jgi:hypothetical protein
VKRVGAFPYGYGRPRTQKLGGSGIFFEGLLDGGEDFAEEFLFDILWVNIDEMLFFELHNNAVATGFKTKGAFEFYGIFEVIVFD